jgi:Tfp pilus assembly protein PilN
VSQVNLLPPELLARQKQRRLTGFIVAGAAGVMILILIFWFFQGQKLNDVNDKIAAQNATNAQLQQQVTELQEFQQLQQDATQKQALLTQAFRGEVSLSGILMDVSRVIPPDAYLTSLSIQLTATGEAATGGTAAPAEPTAASFVGQITTGGQAAGTESLASWLTRLESVKGWVNAWVSTLTETAASSRLYTFSSGVDLTPDSLTNRAKEAASG